ncbi:MAG TPA: Holliday junction resolvase RuvX, partial [Segeticoccus sp.]|nr:Holliday junction resolvase RuvX [Segeticoccus sp.]
MRPGVRLGVDVGSVRVGLAVSDPAGVLATPVATLPRDEADRTDRARVVDEAARRGALEVVVGLPRSLSGREGPAAEQARAYARSLDAMLAARTWDGDRPRVRMVDERLTTVDAHRQLRESGVAGPEQRAQVDQAAAVLILQAALDAERAGGN